MVRADGADVFLQKFEPQRLLFRGRAQGRGALGGRADADGVFGIQRQVVGAGFTGDIDSALAGRPDQGDARRGTDMHDVQPAAGGARIFNGGANGVQFGLNGPRIQIIAHR